MPPKSADKEIKPKPAEDRGKESVERKVKGVIGNTESHPRTSARSKTQPKMLRYVRCHECHANDFEENFVVCRNALCGLYFCGRCLKKYEVRIEQGLNM